MELNYIHIVDVGNHLTEKPQVRKLGVTLGLEAREVDSILEYNKDNINEAAYKVLQKWFQSESSRTTVYANLNTALHDIKLSMIASDVFHSKYADATGAFFFLKYNRGFRK